MASGNRYRTDLIQFAVGAEGANAYGTAVRCDKQVGLINSGLTLADPNYEWTPFYGIGVDSRDMTFPVQGREVLQGNIPNIMYCHDASRFLAYMGLGSYSTTAGGIYGVPGDDFYNSMSGNHFLKEALVLPSFTLGAIFRSVAGVGTRTISTTNTFSRFYTGCKVSRLTLNLNEGQPVMMNVDYIAQDVITEKLNTYTLDEDNMRIYTNPSVNPKEGTVPALSFNAISEQPFYFSTARLTYHGVEFARFRNLTITLDNQLDPRYYVRDYNDTGDGRQILSEILEGRVAVTFRGQLDVDSTSTDAIFLQHLLRQGDLSADSGNSPGGRNPQDITGVRFDIELRRHGSGTMGDTTNIYIPEEGVGEVLLDSDGASIGSIGDDQKVGLVLRSAAINIAAPPAIHVPQDIDGFAASISMKITDA